MNLIIFFYSTTLDKGMSPNIARSILFHAQVMDDVIVSTLTEEQLQQLYRYFAAWASLFLEDSVHGAVRHPRIVHYDRHNRNVSEYVPIAFTDHTMTSMTNELSIYSDNTSVSSFLTRFYTLQERQNEFIALRTACTKKLLIRQKVPAIPLPSEHIPPPPLSFPLIYLNNAFN